MSCGCRWSCCEIFCPKLGGGEAEIPGDRAFRETVPYLSLIHIYMDYEGIINYLLSNSNRIDTVEIMFPEGGNILEVAQRLEENGVCSAKDVLAVANSSDFDDYDLIAAASSKGRYYKLEGYLLSLIHIFLLQYVGYWTLFPYAVLFVTIAFCTMCGVRHGDSRPVLPKDKLEMLDVEE